MGHLPPLPLMQNYGKFGPSHEAKLSKIRQMWHLQMVCSKFAIEVNPFFRPVFTIFWSLIFCISLTAAPKMLLLRSRITLRYYLDFVTVILTAPSLQTYVVPRAVTEQTVTQSRRQVKFSVSKWLKLTQFHLLTPFFDWKKQFCKGKTYKTYE